MRIGRQGGVNVALRFGMRTQLTMVAISLCGAAAFAVEAPSHSAVTPNASALPSQVTLPLDSGAHFFSMAAEQTLTINPGGIMTARGWLSSASDEEWFRVQFGGTTSVTLTLQDVALPSLFDLSAYAAGHRLVAAAPTGPSVKTLVVNDDGSHANYVRISVARWSPQQPNFTLVVKAPSAG